MGQIYLSHRPIEAVVGWDVVQITFAIRATLYANDDDGDGEELLHLGVSQYDFSTVDELEEALKAHEAYAEIAHIVTMTPELRQQLEEDKATSPDYWDWFTRHLHPDSEERNEDECAAG